MPTYRELALLRAYCRETLPCRQYMQQYHKDILTETRLQPYREFQKKNGGNIEFQLQPE